MDTYLPNEYVAKVIFTTHTGDTQTPTCAESTRNENTSRRPPRGPLRDLVGRGRRRREKSSINNYTAAEIDVGLFVERFFCQANRRPDIRDFIKRR